MAKDKTVYVCDYCGQESVKWMGKCPACNRWGTMKEMKIAAPSKPSTGKIASHTTLERPAPQQLHTIEAGAEPRIDMGDGELNRVLGGGLVPGSLVLLGGEPGIGKSTLTLQTVLQLQGRRILYVSGEESARQIKLRADRLGPVNEGLYVLCETCTKPLVCTPISTKAPKFVMFVTIPGSNIPSRRSPISCTVGSKAKA